MHVKYCIKTDDKHKRAIFEITYICTCFIHETAHTDTVLNEVVLNNVNTVLIDH